MSSAKRTLTRTLAARFEEEAYARLRRGFLSDQTQELLQRMHTDAHAPSAVLLRGLPCEDDLPPTGDEPPVAMVGCTDDFLAGCLCLRSIAQVQT